MTKDKIEEGLPRTKDLSLTKSKEGLPWQAFAIVRDKDDPETWKLPHHTKAITRAIKGKIGLREGAKREETGGKTNSSFGMQRSCTCHFSTTVDWERMPAAVAALSPAGHPSQSGGRVEASEGEILSAARHLATHYRKADNPVPDALAVLI